MGLRYEEVTDTVMEMVKDIRAMHFPELKNAKIKVLFDLKKRRSGGALVMGRIMKTNDLLRHLTIDEAEAIEGYDYIIALDKVCWDNIADKDRVKLLRHELRHAYSDVESTTTPYKLRDHTITDFYEEVELNQEDPRWRERIAAIAESIYDLRGQMDLFAAKGRKK